MKEVEVLESEKPIGYELEEYSLIYKIIRYLYLAYESSKQNIILRMMLMYRFKEI
mgnify:CR=1 FL=1